MVVKKRKRTSSVLEKPAPRRITRAAAAPAITEDKRQRTEAARSAVFDTAELLENILVQLPVKEIFVAQRVCKAFRDTIGKSPSLQDKLWIKKIGPAKQSTKWQVQGSGVDLCFVKFAADELPTDEPDLGVLDVVQPNPCIFRRREENFIQVYPESPRESSHAFWIDQMGGDDAWFHKRLLPTVTRFFHGHATSMENVQLSDPPCKEARLDFTILVGGVLELRCTRGPSVYNPHGVTVGALMDNAFRRTITKGDGMIAFKSFSRRPKSAIAEIDGETLPEFVRAQSQAGEMAGEVEVISCRVPLPNCVVPFDEELDRLG